jgi:hypothetical protein
VLINYYQQALNPKMVAEIILKGTAQTLDEWMTVATQLDAAQRMINHLQNPIAQRSQHHRKTFKPNFHYRSKTERYGEPMDVDALISPAVREHRQDKGLCFECGRPGHMARECPSRGSTSRAPQPSQQLRGNPSRDRPPQPRPRTFGAKRQGKPYPPKKMNPQQTRQHIRAIVEENFDTDSQEYRDFVKEVEEKGF